MRGERREVREVREVTEADTKQPDSQTAKQPNSTKRRGSRARAQSGQAYNRNAAPGQEVPILTHCTWVPTDLKYLQYLMFRMFLKYLKYLKYLGT